MYCLRCGRETQDDHVFCEQCRKDMERYPVMPGTAIVLPSRKENMVPKKTRRHVPAAQEDQLRKLKKQRSRLCILVTVLCLLLLLAGSAVVFLIEHEEVHPGQNYSAVTEATIATE